MPGRPTEMKWNDGARLAVTLGSTLAAAFTPLTLIYGSHIGARYVSSQSGVSLDNFSIVSNMSLLFFCVAFATGLFAVFFVGTIFLNGWLKLLISVDLAMFGLGGIATEEIDYILIGASCLLLLAMMWIKPISRYVRSKGKQVLVAIWITSVMLLLIFYSHLGVGPLRAYPFSQFGPRRIQLALFGVELYLALVFWVSLNILNKNPFGREKEDPAIYVSVRTYHWMMLYLPVVGVCSFLACGLLSITMERLGTSDWACLILSVLGHVLLVFSLLARLVAKKIMWVCLSPDEAEIEEALNSIKSI